MKNRRFERQIHFLQKRLSPEGFAGLHLTIGVLIIVLAGWWFGAIAEDLTPNDPLVLLDQRVAVWFHHHATPAITHVARAITFFGSVGWVTIVSVAVALFFICRRAWTNLLLLALTMIGGSTLNIVLKHFFHRQRPILENPLVTLSSYGFPSGHTMGATMLYGLLALLAAKHAKSHRARAACFVAACVLILLIGLSRIYLGAHYLSDVLGAIAAGIVWLTLCWTAVETLRRRRSSTWR
jgi:undecaprenyl-diphosphatase